MVKKRFEYLLIFLGLFIICLNFVSAAAPTFTTVPGNTSIFYGNGSVTTSLFNATNTSAFGNYSINDSRFLITQIGFTTNNQTAILTNATPMTNFAVGVYVINVTINNSVAAGNSSVLYLVQVNKSNYFDCGVYFNTTSPINYPASFIAYTNCSSAYTIYMNGTQISNITTINFGATAYNISVQRNDTQNYTNTFNQQQFIINKGTSVVKAYINNSEANSTIESGASVWLNATLTTGALGGGSLGLLVDDGSQNSSSTLTSLSVYYTTFNVLGFHNVTASFTGNQNYTSSSETFNVTVRDTTAPTYTLKSVSSTEIGSTSVFSIYVNDNTALQPNKQYIFSMNDTGVWVNDSGVNFTTTPSWANVTKTLNTTLGKFVGYRWFFNDTSGNTNSTPIYVLTTTADTESPTYSDSAIENGYAGRANAFTITVNDNIALETNGQYIFSTDNSGTWVNDTAVNFASTSEVARSVKTLNSTVGKVVSYRWFFSDNVGNTNSTPIYSLTTIYFPGSSGGSSATAGGSTPSSTTYTADEQFSSPSGDEYSMKAADRVNFAVSGSPSHSLTVKSFTSESANIQIMSTPIAATLQKGVLYGFDLTGDGVNDINVRYNGLVGTKASIFMQEIVPVVAANPPAQETTTTPAETTADNTNTNQETTNTPSSTSTTSTGSSKLNMSILVIAIVAVIIILLVIILKRTKHHKKKKYYSMY